MKYYYVYILKCSDKSYYTGITNNIENRLYKHNEGLDRNSYTFNRRPVELMFSMKFTYILQAISFEKQLKGWTRKKKEALMKNDFQKLKELAKSVDPSSGCSSNRSG